MVWPRGTGAPPCCRARRACSPCVARGLHNESIPSRPLLFLTMERLEGCIQRLEISLPPDQPMPSLAELAQTSCNVRLEWEAGASPRSAVARVPPPSPLIVASPHPAAGPICPSVAFCIRGAAQMHEVFLLPECVRLWPCYPTLLPPFFCHGRLYVQDWSALPHSLLGEVFRRLLEQHVTLEEILRAWQV